jgi:O-antigen/teichoic acid export membrane protein
VVVGMFSASNIITLVFGQAFIGATLSLQILLPAAIFLFIHPLLSFTLISNNKQSLLIPASAGAFLTNLALDLILIPIYGNIGACIANLVSYGVLFGLTFYFVNKHILSVSLGSILIKPLAALSLITPIIYFVRGQALILVILIASIAYGVSLIALKAFSDDTLDLLKNVFKKVYGT